MKTPRCPLCGEELALSVQSYGFEYVCWKCKWQTASLCPTRQGAEKAAQKLISKFPPIMRVHPGDKLHDKWRGLVTVESVDKEDCVITVRTVKGNVSRTYCDDVNEWPWEIEQE